VEGRQAARVDSEQALELLSAAMSLWRGRALQDVACDHLLLVASDHLENARVTTSQALAMVQLARNFPDEAIETLENLVVEHPLMEGLYAQLMLALYRSGRYSEALETYSTARQRLAQELGIEPSPLLEQRLRAILQHDESLL
jgi:DNA-binding SARP family transcriptional activator